MPFPALTLRRLMPALWLAAMTTLAPACDHPQQSDGRVAAVIDARTLRLHDGREVRLTGLAPFARQDRTAIATSLLGSLVAGRTVTLHAETDTPDRYGRSPAVLRLDANGPSVQAMLAAQGGAIADDGPDTACAAELREAEADARHNRVGIWRDASVIKSAESPGDILAGIGHFMIVEGRVLSVRQAGSVTYVNFGRRWTRDFAVTISGKVLPAFEAAGLKPAAFTGKRVRIRGFAEQRGPNAGPRIEAIRPGQIEIVGATDVAGTSE